MSGSSAAVMECLEIDQKSGKCQKIRKKQFIVNFVYGALVVCIFIILLNMMWITASVGVPQRDSWQNVGNFTVPAEILVLRMSCCALSGTKKYSLALFCLILAFRVSRYALSGTWKYSLASLLFDTSL